VKIPTEDKMRWGGEDKGTGVRLVLTDEQAETLLEVLGEAQEDAADREGHGAPGWSSAELAGIIALIQADAE